MVWVPATGIAIARSLPSVPEKVEVKHSVEVIVKEIPAIGVDVDPGKLRFGEVRVDVPNMPEIPK